MDCGEIHFHRVAARQSIVAVAILQGWKQTLGAIQSLAFHLRAVGYILYVDAQFGKHALDRNLHHIAGGIVAYPHIGYTEIGIGFYTIGIGQANLDIVPIGHSTGLPIDGEWRYEIGGGQDLIVACGKLEALASHLLSTCVAFFFYERTIIGVEYPEFYVVHSRTLVGLVGPRERYGQTALYSVVMNTIFATGQQEWDTQQHP